MSIKDNRGLQVLLVLVVVIAAIFGYFMKKSHGDFTLAKAMMVFEAKKLMGGASSSAQDYTSSDEQKTETTDESAAEVTPHVSQHTKDSIYQGDSNSFSDVKKQGGDSRVDMSRDDL